MRVVGKVRIPVQGENVKLYPVKTYYKRNEEKLLQCTIVESPYNAWRKIVEYAKMLMERYNKKVELKIVSSNGKEYLKYHREDGIPIYIDKEGNFYVCKKYRNEMAKINVGIRFIAETCGYKVKVRTAVNNWIR